MVREFLKHFECSLESIKALILDVIWYFPRFDVVLTQFMESEINLEVPDFEDLDEYEARVEIDRKQKTTGRSQVVTDLDLRISDRKLRLVFKDERSPPVERQPSFASMATDIPIVGFQGATSFMDYKADYAARISPNWASLTNYKYTVTPLVKANIEIELARLREHRMAKRMRSVQHRR